MMIVQRIPILIFINIIVEFIELEKLTQRFYTIAKALSFTNRIERIDKKEFAKAALDENSEIFIIHALALEITTIYPSRAA